MYQPNLQSVIALAVLEISLIAIAVWGGVANPNLGEGDRGRRRSGMVPLNGSTERFVTSYVGSP